MRMELECHTKVNGQRIYPMIFIDILNMRLIDELIVGKSFDKMKKNPCRI